MISHSENECGLAMLASTDEAASCECRSLA